MKKIGYLFNTVKKKEVKAYYVGLFAKVFLKTAHPALFQNKEWAGCAKALQMACLCFLYEMTT